MKTFLCLVTVVLLLFASIMFWMSELVGRGVVLSPVSPTRYFVAGIVFAGVAVVGLRAAIEKS